MFAPKIAKTQAKATVPTNYLTPNRSTLGHRVGHGPVEQAFLPVQVSTPENSMTREAPRSISWNFNKIPLFPPDRASRSQLSPLLPGFIQPKLVVGQVNDPLEHE